MQGSRAEICTYVRAVQLDIDYAADYGADSVHLVIPVSDLHIEKKLRKTRDQVYAMAMDAVAYAKDRGLIVELSGEDASRADPAFLRSVYSGGLECGADRLCFCDTVGLLTPERVAEIIPPLCLAPLSIHCHDDLGMGMANTIAALRAGASCAHVTVNGLGERAGNTPFEELVMALEILYNYRTGITYPGDIPARCTGVAAYRRPSPHEQGHRGRDGLHPRERDPCPRGAERAEHL